MTLDEQDKFIQHVMANCDTAMAATAELTTHTGTSTGTLVEREANNSDFVRSSRDHNCKGNLTILRRVLHSDLAKGNSE
jgi:hypothetical protein